MKEAPELTGSGLVRMRSQAYQPLSGLPKIGALFFCMENPVAPVVNQMEQTFPLEIFRKKRNTFKGIPFFSFLLHPTSAMLLDKLKVRHSDMRIP